MRMARITRGSTMNEMILMTPPQSGQSNGSNSNTFLMKRVQLPRAVFAAPMSAESAIGVDPSGWFSIS